MGNFQNSMSHKDLKWDYSDPVNGQSLPAPFFYDPDIFEQEKTHIFMNCWHFVGHINEFKEPGSYVVQDVFEQSVVITTEKDGNIYAWHNVCRHRGNRLMNERRGKVNGMLRCPYHSWCYSLNGDLRAAPRTEHLDNFSKKDHSLRKVRLEIFAGWVFITLDDDAGAISEMMAGAEAEMRTYLPDMDDVELAEETDVIVNANWKVIQENSIEGYHFDLSGPVHKDLAALIDFKGYRLTAYQNYWTYIGPPNNNVTHAYGLPLDGATWQTNSFFNIGLWPNTTFYSFPYTDMVGVFIMIPLAPEKSLLRFSYYVPRGRPVPDVTKAAIDWMNTQLGPEDIMLNETNQKGLHSIGFGSGRYLIDDSLPNESEHLVFNFHKLCYQAIRE